MAKTGSGVSTKGLKKLSSKKPVGDNFLADRHVISVELQTRSQKYQAKSIPNVMRTISIARTVCSCLTERKNFNDETCLDQTPGF